MGKWAGILLVVMIAAAVVGFLVDAVRFIAGALFVVCLVMLAVQWLGRRFGSNG